MGNRVGIQEKTGIESRIAQLKKNIEALMDEGVRKTTFYPLIAESLAKTKGQPQQIRRALAFEHLLDNVKLEVLPYELLGGSILGMWPVDTEVPHYEDQYALAEKAIEDVLSSQGTVESETDSIRYEARAVKTRLGRLALMARDHYDANIDYTRLQAITKDLKKKYEGSGKISPQKISQTLETFFQYDYGDDVMNLIDSLPWVTVNHLHLNYGMIVALGYDALLDKIETKLAHEQDPEKQEFYTASEISIKAAIRYIERYAGTFADAAKNESNNERSAELILIAAILKKVAHEKAGSFREAMQLLWITHIIANTALGSALSFGRFDQYMYPYYEKDIKSGAIAHNEAVALLCCMMLKINEPKMRTVQSVVLAGITPDGKDAANELTKIFLEAARIVKLPYPNIAVRIAEGFSPEWLYEESINTIKEGFGMPMLINDDVWIKNFVALGYPDTIARDYYNMGCVEMLIANRQAGWLTLPNSRIYYPLVLLDIMEAYKKGELPIESFDELFEIFLKEIRTRIRNVKLPKDYVFPHSRGCDPFGSMFVDGCLESGKDIYHGGSEIAEHIPLSGYGLATATDSLMTIKTIVFDRKELTLNELINMVENNFKGQERMRQYILNNIPHYGNDDEYIDNMAARILDVFTTEVFNLNDGTILQKYVSSYFSYTGAVSSGEMIGATPDGRLAGEPLSDGLGPVQGRDSQGPTKFFNTMLNLNYSYLNGALATNIKVNPSLFSTNGGTIALTDLIKTYLHNGGPQVQVNFVSRADLLDAQINPQKHRDLVVRIAGFCEYFIYLDINQQNEIIQRTEHE
jgi:formate C-acetyltransferase